MIEYADPHSFKRRNDLKSVVLSYTVTSIGVKAFGQCKHLESITVFNIVTIIGEQAFWRYLTLKCAGLTSLVLPVTSIGSFFWMPRADVSGYSKLSHQYW